MVRASAPEASPPTGVVRATAPEAPLGFTSAASGSMPPTAVGEGLPPASAGEGFRKPGAITLESLAAQVAEQASATTRLQEQLGAALVNARRAEEEAEQRQAESKVSTQMLADQMRNMNDTMVAMQAYMAQQVSALEFSRQKDT